MTQDLFSSPLPAVAHGRDLGALMPFVRRYLCTFQLGACFPLAPTGRTRLITAGAGGLIVSHRRHLLPEFQSENRASRMLDGELHHGEAGEERVSLSDRFGLWIAFHPFSQIQHLTVVRHWLDRLEPSDDETKRRNWTAAV